MTKNWRTPEDQLIIAALVGVAVEWWMAHGYDALGPGMDAAASSISGWKQTGVSVTCSPNKPQLSWALPDSWLGRCASHLAPTEKWFASVYTRYLTYVYSGMYMQTPRRCLTSSSCVTVTRAATSSTPPPVCPTGACFQPSTAGFYHRRLGLCMAPDQPTSPLENVGSLHIQ